MTCWLYSICARTHTHTLTKELQQDVDWRNNRKQAEDAELVQKRKAIYVLTVLTTSWEHVTVQKRGLSTDTLAI